jgi:hypothetical protein
LPITDNGGNRMAKSTLQKLIGIRFD